MLNEVDEHGAACPQSGFAGGRTGHPFPARHQGDAQGDAAGRRPAADPVRASRNAWRPGSRSSSSSPAAARARIEDHFDRAYELRGDAGQQRGKTRELKQTRAMPPSSRATRSSPASRSRWAWAMRSGAPATGSADEPFAVLLPDELIHRHADLHRADGGGPRARPAATWWRSWRCRASRPRATASPRSRPEKDGLAEVTGLVEKPKPEEAPSTPGGDRPLRPACPRCSTISTGTRPAPAARSSSPTPWPS